MFLKKAVTTVCMVLTSISSYAELTFPTEPPSVQQIQKPSEKDKVLGTAIPISLEQNTEDKNTQNIQKLIKQTLLNKYNLVWLPITITETDRQAGEARNIATDPIQAQLHIKLNVEELEKPLVGSDYLPVTLQLQDQQGNMIKTQTFDYRQTEEAQFIDAIDQILASYTGKLPVTEIAQPQLKTWIETKDGKPVKTGSGLAIYFQPDTKGYVSLYHFDSAKSVQRLYPSVHEPINFVQPGVTYRYPAKGYLTVEGEIGEEMIKSIFTRWSSNMPRVVDGLKSKTAPLNIIPTHYPVLFATGDMTRFFALPKTHYTESHLHYTITK